MKLQLRVFRSFNKTHCGKNFEIIWSTFISKITRIGSNKVSSDVSFCPIISKADNLLDKITLYLSIYIPTILGPFITFIIGVVCLPFSSGWRSRGISPCSLLLLPGLILIHLSNYYINLVLADTHQNEFHYILVKYGLGFSFIILSPILIIATQKEIRIGVKKTFKSSVLFAVQNKEKNWYRFALCSVLFLMY